MTQPGTFRLSSGAHVAIVRFLDRAEAGTALGRAMLAHRQPDALVLAIPRGGVVIGAHVARFLGLELEVVAACKVQVPARPELSMGAVAEGGIRQVDLGLAGVLKVAPGEFRGAVRSAEEEVERRVRAYRQGRPLLDLRGRAAFLVDDGIARGVTMRAAAEAVRRLGPDRLIIAAPVASAFAADMLASLADGIVTLVRPAVLRSVSEWYEDFSPLADSDVLSWLEAGRRSASGEHAVA